MSKSMKQLPEDLAQKSYKMYCTSFALDGSENDILSQSETDLVWIIGTHSTTYFTENKATFLITDYQ